MPEANRTFSDLVPSRAAPRLLVFDSGLGGLSVLNEITRRQPSADIIYVADDAGFPYGAWSEAALIEHVVGLVGDLIVRHAPDLVVIACNTASTLVLPPLRLRYSLPFVGTVPAIKPAAEATQSGLVSVLATPGTVARDYTRQLIDAFAGSADVTLVGSTLLANLAEGWLRGETIDEGLIAGELAPCFRAVDGRRTDTIVLGCTHYPLLLPTFRRLAPWAVNWIDGASAIARRVDALIPAGRTEIAEPGPGRLIFTSGLDASATLREAVRTFGLRL
jgi:glutamate racemase